MEINKIEENPLQQNEIQNVENQKNENINNDINNISEKQQLSQTLEQNDSNNNINENIIQENSKIIINNENDSNKITQETLYEEYDSDNSALSNSDISENDIDSITTRTSKNKNMDLETFYKQNRQYFIMTEGGTPIYSRYGDEIKNCSLSATFSAIITKFVAFNGGINNENESLNYLKNEYSLVVFLKKGKLFFITVSNKNDSVSFLYRQLELLYHQLLSVITNSRMHALEEKPSTCAKLLTNSNYLFEQMIEYTSHSMVGILKSYQVLPIDNRIKLNEICSKYRGDALVTCLITLNAKEIIALSKSSVIELTYQDMILIQSLIMTCGSLRENESWVPLCMPGISADGFLQLYSNFLPPNQYGILYITEKQEQTSFSTFTELSRKIYDEIKEKGFLPSIEKAIETKKNAEYIKEEIENNTQEINVESLKEFLKKTFGNKNKSKSLNAKSNEMNNPNDIIGKSSTLPDAYRLYHSTMKKENVHQSRIISIGKIATKQNSKNDPLLKMNYGIVHHRINSQFFTVNLHSHDHLTREEKYVLKTYIKLFDYYSSFSKNLNNPDNFYHIEKDNKFSHGIYINENFIVFGTFNLFKPNYEISETLKESAKLAKQYETNFFISLKQS
jgi:hypothetical protein